GGPSLRPRRRTGCRDLGCRPGQSGRESGVAGRLLGAGLRRHQHAPRRGRRRCGGRSSRPQRRGSDPGDRRAAASGSDRAPQRGSRLQAAGGQHRARGAAAEPAELRALALRVRRYSRRVPGEPTEDAVLLGDNLELLPAFEDGSFQLAYIDPPFNTGREQRRRTLKTTAKSNGDRVGFGGRRYETSLLAERAYADRFDDYLAFLEPR